MLFAEPGFYVSSFPFDRKFICKLPDRGKKIIESVCKLKAAIAEREAIRDRSEPFRPIRVDCKVRQKGIAGVDVDTAKAQNSDQILDISSLVPSCSSVDDSTSSRTTSPEQGLGHRLDDQGEPGEAEDTILSSRANATSASETSQHVPQRRASSQAEANASCSDSLVIDRLQRITIADPGEHGSEKSPRAENVTGLPSRTQKRPHYLEVLEMRAQNPVPPPHKFKTNVLPSQPNDPCDQCPRSESPVSSEERLRRDKKHLDDITAARLLPLHHLPTQLLSIEESLALQKQQKQSYEEMQAKLAAQKLAERLNIKMQSYNPEGKTMGRYREARDEDGPSSDDEL
ncbi:protein GRINL1A [Echinops telfairi]|uniref:Protein GRINL1A n=1 Tax=Echinops telfairi TaxID=9371 RepID=A0AC55CSF7_ECHTE|nr:protein GRINL1A [Echinops telfairi]